MKYDVLYWYEASVNKLINYYESPLCLLQNCMLHAWKHTLFLLRGKKSTTANGQEASAFSSVLNISPAHVDRGPSEYKGNLSALSGDVPLPWRDALRLHMLLMQQLRWEMYIVLMQLHFCSPHTLQWSSKANLCPNLIDFKWHIGSLDWFYCEFSSVY